MNAATPEEAGAHLAVLFAIGIITFTSGATGLASQVPHLLGAQVDDNLLVALAVLALTTGTAIFAFVFKMLLQVKDSQARVETKAVELERDVERLEERISRMDDRLNAPRGIQ